MKNKQNDNPDMHHANCNANNVRKVLVKNFYSSHVIMLLYDDKFVVKIGVQWCPLAFCPKTKAGWVAQTVDVIAADHGTFVNFNLVPVVTFDADITNNPNLGSLCNGHTRSEVKKGQFFQLLLLGKQWRLVGSSFTKSIKLCFYL